MRVEVKRAVKPGNDSHLPLLQRTTERLVAAATHGVDGDEAQVASNFSVHLYDKRSSRTHLFFGRYSHTLSRQADRVRIARKKIILLNDTIPTVLDFYCI